MLASVFKSCASFLLISGLALALAAPAAAQATSGGGSIGGGNSTTDNGNSLDVGLEGAKEAVKKSRPDGSSQNNDGTQIQFPGGASLSKGVMATDDSEWEVTYPGCQSPAGIKVKPPVKECRADATDKTAYFYETQYIEFNCPDLTPPFRRLAISFKKLGPCKVTDYEDSKKNASTFGETWVPSEEIKIVEETPGGGGGGTGTAGGEGAGSGTNLVPVSADTGDASDNAIWVIWNEWHEHGTNTFMAAYYPDGSSKWIYKADDTQFPSEKPPPMPPKIGKTELKFKTASTTPTEETPGKSTGGGKESKTKTGSGKGKGKAAEKKGKKGTVSAAPDSGNAANVVGTGVAIGLSIAGSHHGGGGSHEESRSKGGKVGTSKGMSGDHGGLPLIEHGGGGVGF